MKKKYAIYSLVFSIVILILAFLSYSLVPLTPPPQSNERTTFSNIEQVASLEPIISILVILNALFGLGFFIYLLVRREEGNRILSVLQMLYLISLFFLGSIPVMCSQEVVNEFTGARLCDLATATSGNTSYIQNPYVYISAGLIALIIFFVSLFFLFKKTETF